MELKIFNDSISVMGETLKFEIRNHASKDFILRADFSSYKYFVNESVNKIDNQGLTMLIYDNMGDLVPLDYTLINFSSDSLTESVVQTRMNEILDERDEILHKHSTLISTSDSLWVYNYGILQKNSILVPKDKSKQVELNMIPFNSKESYVLLGSIGYELNENENYFLELRLEIDSSETKKYLLQKEIDSLRKSNIKIFHGTLTSNKVPIMFEEE